MSSPARAAPDLTSMLVGYGDLVRATLAPYLEVDGAAAPMYGMIAYHLGWVDNSFQSQTLRAGKALRPALCLLMAEALGVSASQTAAFAAGIELLHNFSLVHDDIQDHSATRRGRETVWRVWGEAQAINVGDALFSLAHRLWLDAPLAATDPAACLAILGALENMVLALCEGQYLDMSGEGSLEVSSERYLAMIARKSAALIGESAWVGARVTTAAPEVLDAARAFGVNLGLAFQIRDDLLGIWGDEQETGKSASSDIATRKMTLPVVLALEDGPPTTRSALRARYGGAPTSDNDEAQVRALLEEAGADRRAADEEERHWRAAMRALERLPLSPPWRDRLVALARLFVARRS